MYTFNYHYGQTIFFVTKYPLCILLIDNVYETKYLFQREIVSAGTYFTEIKSIHKTYLFFKPIIQNES
jgi:hypothetical protein